MVPAHLTDITSIKEQEFVVNLLTAHGIKDAWFGLQLSLFWSDGSTLLPGSWYDVIINDDLSTCFRLENHGTNEYRWNDAQACTDAYGYVCEYEGT